MERICSQREQILSFKSSPYLGSDKLFPLIVSSLHDKEAKYVLLVDVFLLQIMFSYA